MPRAVFARRLEQLVRKHGCYRSPSCGKDRNQQKYKPDYLYDHYGSFLKPPTVKDVYRNTNVRNDKNGGEYYTTTPKISYTAIGDTPKETQYGQSDRGTETKHRETDRATRHKRLRDPKRGRKNNKTEQCTLLPRLPVLAFFKVSHGLAFGGPRGDADGREAQSSAFNAACL